MGTEPQNVDVTEGKDTTTKGVRRITILDHLFHAQEVREHEDLFNPIDEDVAGDAVLFVTRLFGTPRPGIRFYEENPDNPTLYGYAGPSDVYLCRQHLSVYVAVHEAAHYVVLYRTRKTTQRSPHDAKLAEIIMFACSAYRISRCWTDSGIFAKRLSESC